MTGGEEQSGSEVTELSSAPHQAKLSGELQQIMQEQRASSEVHTDQRLELFQGVTPVEAGTVGVDKPFRYLITAAVQSSPKALAEFLAGGEDASGFHVTERPVNASLIDQEHTATFEGLNGYILEPPTDGDDVVAARPYDFASNDLEPQPIEFDADSLLTQTSPDGYNHINIKQGKLAGIFIRKTRDGQELGDAIKNAELRQVAQEKNLQIVEIEVEPKELKFGEAKIEQLPANEGNRLWKVQLPEDGSLREVDIIQFNPAEHPKGFTLDEAGFDLRVQDIDGYGQSTYVMADVPVLIRVLERVTDLQQNADPANRPALEFASRRIKQAIDVAQQAQS